MPMLRTILIVTTILVIALAALGIYQVKAMDTWLNSPKNLAGETQTFDIREGTSVRGALKLMIEKGVVADSLFLRFVGRVGKLPVSSVKAGEYEFSPAKTPIELLLMLAEGRVKTYPFTVPEGLRLEEVAAIFTPMIPRAVADFKRLAHDKAFLASLGVPSLEGFLFPETYKIPKGYTVAKIIHAMIQMYHSKFNTELGEKAKELGLDAYQTLIIASIIEKEAGGVEEFPLVSSVIHNRLKKGMPLQMDPTVIYGLENFNGNLTRHDLLTDHAWNTYTRQGLPATPICNPGFAALRAAVGPAQTSYLYFVAMNNGHHTFSSTLAQHNAAVQKFQIEGQVGP